MDVDRSSPTNRRLKLPDRSKLGRLFRREKFQHRASTRSYSSTGESSPPAPVARLGDRTSHYSRRLPLYEYSKRASNVSSAYVNRIPTGIGTPWKESPIGYTCAVLTMTDFGRPLSAAPMTTDFTCANPGKLLINAVKNSWIVP